MPRYTFIAACTVLAALAGCSNGNAPSPSAPPVTQAPAAPATFVDRIWVVSESAPVSQGDVRVFLPDGTLVMISAHGTPTFGRWRQVDGKLTITEEGLDYATDILELTPDVLRIRMHSPGDPVDITFAPAGEVLHVTGTVHHLDIEGGQYVIRDASGTTYSPTNLAAEHQVEGLAVEVAARRRDDLMSIGMTGPLIELLKVTRLPTQAGSGTAGPALAGIWTVVGHVFGGVSALDGAQARAYHGRSLWLMGEEAVSGTERCATPRYSEREVARDTFLATEYRLAPRALAALADRQQLTVLEVRCGDNAWSALGARLIGIDADRALAPWNGVFFELARGREHQAVLPAPVTDSGSAML